MAAHWYTPFVVGYQFRAASGRWSTWKETSGKMSIQEARQAYDNGTHEMFQVREPEHDRIALVAMPRKERVKREKRRFATRAEGRP